MLEVGDIVLYNKKESDIYELSVIIGYYPLNITSYFTAVLQEGNTKVARIAYFVYHINYIDEAMFGYFQKRYHNMVAYKMQSALNCDDVDILGNQGIIKKVGHIDMTSYIIKNQMLGNTPNGLCTKEQFVENKKILDNIAEKFLPLDAKYSIYNKYSSQKKIDYGRLYVLITSIGYKFYIPIGSYRLKGVGASQLLCFRVDAPLLDSTPAYFLDRAYILRLPVMLYHMAKGTNPRMNVEGISYMDFETAKSTLITPIQFTKEQLLGYIKSQTVVLPDMLEDDYLGLLS